MTTETDLPKNSPNENESVCDGDNSSEWLKDRKQELASLFDEKARVLSTKAKVRVTESMNRIEHAIRKASNNLSKNDEPQAASVADSVADQLHQTSQYVAEVEPAELVEASSSKVKKSPAIALVTAAAAGLLIGRIIKQVNEPGNTSQSSNS